MTISSQPQQDAPEPKFFDQIEASFSAIASQYPQPHRRLLALSWCAKFHGVSVGVFRQAFEMWLEATERGEAK